MPDIEEALYCYEVGPPEGETQTDSAYRTKHTQCSGGAKRALISCMNERLLSGSLILSEEVRNVSGAGRRRVGKAVRLLSTTLRSFDCDYRSPESDRSHPSTLSETCPCPLSRQAAEPDQFCRKIIGERRASAQEITPDQQAVIPLTLFCSCHDDLVGVRYRSGFRNSRYVAEVGRPYPQFRQRPPADANRHRKPHGAHGSLDPKPDWGKMRHPSHRAAVGPRQFGPETGSCEALRQNQ